MLSLGKPYVFGKVLIFLSSFITFVSSIKSNTPLFRDSTQYYRHCYSPNIERELGLNGSPSFRSTTGHFSEKSWANAAGLSV